MKTMRIQWAGAVLLAGLLGMNGASAQSLEIATSVPNLGFPFFVHMQKALEAEADNQGDVSVQASDGQNSTPKQTADMEAAIIKGVDGIAISPLDSVAMAPVLQQAVDSGVPVITIDRQIQDVPGILAHFGADNVKGGEAQGSYIIERFPDGARIVNLQGQPGASPAIDRNAGLHQALDGMSDKYEFVAEQTANFAREEGASVTEAILAGLSEAPDVIVAANDDMALGALLVTREQNLDIPIIGFDALPEALASIQAGDLAATVEQFPGGQSSSAMQAMVSFLRDGAEPEALNLLTPVVLTSENVGEAERINEVQ